jgi:hypothetical protein
MTLPALQWRRTASLWAALPDPIAAVHPRPFEYYGQNQGLMLYRTTLVGRKSGKLVLTDLHDFATVFVDGRLIGTIDRRLGEKSIDLPAVENSETAHPRLDILVEGMGHINFAQEIIDRKGITDRATLAGMTLMNWQVFKMPLNDAWAMQVAADGTAIPDAESSPGSFFTATVTLDRVADTEVDTAGFRKGVVWVNGHNLGRFWDIGPQTKLYVPASFLVRGENRVVILDLLR